MPRSRKILVVEDDRLAAWHLSILMREWGYEMAVWTTDHSFSLASFHHFRPDLLLMSCDSGGIMEPYGVLPLVASFLNIPILILSATVPKESVRWEAGISYLSKPFWAHQLKDKIKEGLSNSVYTHY
ncbi:MAG: response regulator [Bacteroidota bacterium]